MHEAEIAADNACLSKSEKQNVGAPVGGTQGQAGPRGFGKARWAFEEGLKRQAVIFSDQGRERLACHRLAAAQQGNGHGAGAADHSRTGRFNKTIAAQIGKITGEGAHCVFMAGAHLGGAGRQHQSRATLPGD
jgi:hypothetical protein